MLSAKHVTKEVLIGVDIDITRVSGGTNIYSEVEERYVFLRKCYLADNKFR